MAQAQAPRLHANYAKGKLKLNEEFISESIIGSHFVAKAVEETKVAGLKGDYSCNYRQSVGIGNSAVCA